MGTEKLELIIDKIRKGSNVKDVTKVAIIENGTLENQRIIIDKLDNIVNKAKQEDIKPPSIVIIGDTVNLNETIKWYKQNSSPSINDKSKFI